MLCHDVLGRCVSTRDMGLAWLRRDLVDTTVDDVMTQDSELTEPADVLGGEDKSEVEIISQYKIKAGRRKFQMKLTTSSFEVDLFSTTHNAMGRTKVNPTRRPPGSAPNMPLNQCSPVPKLKIRTRTPKHRRVPLGKPDTAETESIMIDSSPEPKTAAVPRRRIDVLKNFIEDDGDIDDDNASYRALSPASPSEATELSLREEDLSFSDHGDEGPRAKRRRIQAKQAQIYARFFPPATERARQGEDRARNGAVDQLERSLRGGDDEMADADVDDIVGVPADSPGPFVLQKPHAAARIKAEDKDTIEVQVASNPSDLATASVPAADIRASLNPPPVRKRPLTQCSDAVRTTTGGFSAKPLGAQAYDRREPHRLGQTTSPITLPYTLPGLQEGSRAVTNPAAPTNDYNVSDHLVPPVHDNNSDLNGMGQHPPSPSPLINTSRADPLASPFFSPSTPNTAHPRPSNVSDLARSDHPPAQRNRTSQLGAASNNRATATPTRIFEVAASPPAFDPNPSAPQHVQRAAGSTGLDHLPLRQIPATPPRRFSQLNRVGPAQRRRGRNTSITQNSTPPSKQRPFKQVNTNTNAEADTNAKTNATGATPTHPAPHPPPDPPTDPTSSAETILRLSQHIAHLTDRLATIDEEKAAQMAEIARLHRGLANATAEIGGLRGEIMRLRGGRR